MRAYMYLILSVLPPILLKESGDDSMWVYIVCIPFFIIFIIHWALALLASIGVMLMWYYEYVPIKSERYTFSQIKLIHDLKEFFSETWSIVTYLIALRILTLFIDFHILIILFAVIPLAVYLLIDIFYVKPVIKNYDIQSKNSL